MSTTRLAYDDAVALTDMLGDARAVTTRLHLPQQRADAPAHAAAAGAGTPAISESLAARAADLELHLA
ncbi:hypothetical protein G7072_06545 [Nocardioides sp. HDW12B]|uniref:hypothetical protein n=1 Tax=Nocardioides sp. HDW12B TaxID=2714939 RepID=UPI00140CADE8|nr:hypothetical protein [Nocardioides sp. HDW12B]QIK66042.1 hypothetical protein G7072_06545 [Nocardioides sp. HDW12B]